MIKLFSSLFFLTMNIAVYAEGSLCEERIASPLGSAGKSTALSYEIASCYAENGNKNMAFQFLYKAIRQGFRDDKRILDDKRLLSLYGEKEWDDVVEKIFSARDRYFSSINKELFYLYKNDQEERKVAKINDWEKILENDKKRIKSVSKILSEGKLNHSDDYFHAAMIFQHGNKSSFYKKAHELAIQSVELNPDNQAARWLICATMDRYLLSVKKPQIWGTQYRRTGSTGLWTMEPFDKTQKSDDERIACGVPTLDESIQRLKNMNSK